jgi:hypothetical protein
MRGLASTKAAAADSTTMSWTRSGTASTFWAAVAVPINPKGANAAPHAVGDTASIVQNTLTNLAVLGNDTDADGDNLTITAVSSPDHGTATLSGSGANNTINYTPATDYLGADSLTYTMQDSSGVTDTATVTITVTSTHVAYVGSATASSAASGTSISVPYSAALETGENRLMLVGVAWNCGTTLTANQTISAATYTPAGGTATAMTPLQDYDYLFVNGHRHSAIYYVVDPVQGNGSNGTVNITFSASVASGIVASAAFFSGVDQSDPFGIPGVGIGGGSTSTALAGVTLGGLSGNELVFDGKMDGVIGAAKVIQFHPNDSLFNKSKGSHVTFSGGTLW